MEPVAVSRAGTRGCSSMAELQLPKLVARVRFPSPAPTSDRPAQALLASPGTRRGDRSRWNPLAALALGSGVACVPSHRARDGALSTSLQLSVKSLVSAQSG